MVKVYLEKMHGWTHYLPRYKSVNHPLHHSRYLPSYPYDIGNLLDKMVNPGIDIGRNIDVLLCPANLIILLARADLVVKGSRGHEFESRRIQDAFFTLPRMFARNLLLGKTESKRGSHRPTLS